MGPVSLLAMPDLLLLAILQLLGVRELAAMQCASRDFWRRDQPLEWVRRMLIPCTLMYQYKLRKSLALGCRKVEGTSTRQQDCLSSREVTVTLPRHAAHRCRAGRAGFAY